MAEGSAVMMRATHRRRASDGGFTLVEIIVAMFVLAIVMLAIIFVQARALTTNAASQTRQEATAVANEAMEQLRSMPWNYLRKGLYSGWNSSGTDPYTTGSTLTVNGRAYALRVGTIGSDQDLSDPWPPLFDSTGSNVQTYTSASGNGDAITVRAYTTADQAGASAAVGLVVVATWTDKADGSIEETVLTSTAYAPSAGCGDLNNAPFLASCQAQLESTSSSASLVISATATTADGASEVPVIDGLGFYSFQVSTGTAASQVTSQQVSNTSSFASLGGVQWDDDSNLTAPSVNGWTRGYTQYSLRASDDTTSGAQPPNPGSVTGIGANSTHTFTSGIFSLGARSDDQRSATVNAKTTASCSTGLAFAVPAGAPCASSLVGGTSSTAPYMTLGVDGLDLSLASAAGSTTNNYDRAWSGRFSTTAGNASVGCATVSGSGCTSGGAQQGFGTVTVGAVGLPTGWDLAATSGLARVTGYSDAVMVQRGVGVTAAAPSLSRSATVSYWNGTGYSSVAVGTNTAGTWSIPETTWTTPSAVVRATGEVLVTGATTSSSATTNCIGGDGCLVDAEHGTITVSITYAVEPFGASTFTPWNLVVKSTINGSRAGARFEESPNA